MDPSIATGEGERFDSESQAPARAKFDPDALEASTGLGWAFEFLFAYPQRLIGLARRLAHVVHIPFTNWHVALRHDEVREVLNHDREFPVPWSDKMKGLTRGKNFVLGMKRDEVYKESYRRLARAFPLEDIWEYVEAPSAAIATRIVEAVADREPAQFDAIEELITTVPAELCESYFGIDVPDKVLFAKWTLAISSYTFGPSSDATSEALAMAGAENLSGAIRASIKAAQAGGVKGKAMERLIELQKAEGLDDDTIHAFLFGMVMGFIPTDVLAGGNMLEILLRHPDFLKRARSAAMADDDELLWRCLREALRFRHINPGPWRVCENGYTLGTGSRWEHRIPAGARVLALIQSAMFDERRVERPHVFDPGRPDEAYMIFGIGQHWCIGAYIAKAQITQTLKPLLEREGLHAVRNRFVRTKRFNDLFPLHLRVGFRA